MQGGRELPAGEGGPEASAGPVPVKEGGREKGGVEEGDGESRKRGGTEQGGAGLEEQGRVRGDEVEQGRAGGVEVAQRGGASRLKMRKTSR